MPGLIELIKGRNQRLMESLDAPKKKDEPKKKKKRTHVSQFTNAEIEAMSLDQFSKLDQS